MSLLRSVLFTPGNQQRRVEKARILLKKDADAVILDLEDTIPPAEKESTRRYVGDVLATMHPSQSKEMGRMQVPTVIVRVNGLHTGWTAADLEAVMRPELHIVIVPKVQSAADVAEADRLMRNVEERKGLTPGKIRLIPIVETARGVLNAHAIASATPRTLTLAFGAADYTSDMGVPWVKDPLQLVYARSQIAVAARAAEVEQPLDSVYTDVNDIEGFVADCNTAKILGFQGKMLIHPGQIEPANQAFSPTEAEIDLARRIMHAFDEAVAKGTASLVVDGRMIDYALVINARKVLGQAKAIEQARGKSQEARNTP